MSNSITYDAADHDIHSVTVFQVNRAEVTRRIKLDLKEGQNEILVKNLPNVLDGDSIRVDGIGKAVVFDVIYKRPSYNPPSRNQKESLEIEDFLQKRATLTREKDVVDKQRTILDSYSKTMSSEHAKSDALSEFLRTYGTSQLEFSTKLHDLQDQVAKLDEQIKSTREAEGKLSEDHKLGTRIVVVILAEEDGPAELDLKYNVTGASWTPVYDLRAEVADAESNPNETANGTNGTSNGKPAETPNTSSSKSKITLDYRASISQRTAEDWSKVQLTLSTASPQLGSDIPRLYAIRLDSVSQPPFRAKQKKELARRPATVAARPAALPDEDEESDGDMGFGIYDDATFPPPTAFSAAPVPSAPQFMAHAGSRVSGAGAGFSCSFYIDGLSNIPSDTDDSTESHKVTIAVVKLENVDLEWVTVPKQSPSVFLKAKVKNTSDYTFLAGGASIFMNNNFVAKSSIPRVSPLESFSVSLGIDSSVRVTYHPQSKKISNPTGGFMSTARVSTTFQQSISVKNTRPLPLSRLVVKDQVPISTHAQIKVMVFEPQLPEVQSSKPAGGTIKASSSAAQGSSSSGLAAALKEVSVNGSNDVRARWVRINEESDGGGANASGGGGEVNTEGLVEWICKVDANTGIDLKLGWEVNVPKGFKWRQT